MRQNCTVCHLLFFSSSSCLSCPCGHDELVKEQNYFGLLLKKSLNKLKNFSANMRTAQVLCCWCWWYCLKKFCRMQHISIHNRNIKYNWTTVQKDVILHIRAKRSKLKSAIIFLKEEKFWLQKFDFETSSSTSHEHGQKAGPPALRRTLWN